MSQREYELLVRFRVPITELLNEHKELMGSGPMDGIIVDPKDLMGDILHNVLFEGTEGVRLSGTFTIIEARRVEGA